MSDNVPPELAEYALYYRELPNRRYLVVYGLSAQWGQLAVSSHERPGLIDSSFYYATRRQAIEAAEVFGWRNHPTGASPLPSHRTAAHGRRPGKGAHPVVNRDELHKFLMTPDGHRAARYRLVDWLLDTQPPVQPSVEYYNEITDAAIGLIEANAARTGVAVVLDKPTAESARLFVHRPDRLGEPPSEQLVTSAEVQHVGGHDRVRIWNRGALAGELVVQIGDGAVIAMLLGLEECSS